MTRYWSFPGWKWLLPSYPLRPREMQILSWLLPHSPSQLRSESRKKLTAVNKLTVAVLYACNVVLNCKEIIKLNNNLPGYLCWRNEWRGGQGVLVCFACFWSCPREEEQPSSSGHYGQCIPSGHSTSSPPCPDETNLVKWRLCKKSEHSYKQRNTTVLIKAK